MLAQNWDRVRVNLVFSEAQDAAAKSGLDDNEEDEWVDMFDPVTREWNGPRYGEPTKFGDWQSKGRATDFK